MLPGHRMRARSTISKPSSFLTLLAVVCFPFGLMLMGCDGNGGGKPSLGLTEKQVDETLVKIGDRNVTVGEFADRLASMSPYLRARFESPERRAEFLESFIRFELLVAEAKRLGYDKDPIIVRAERDALVQAYLKQEIDDKVTLASISNEELRAYYDSHLDEFERPAQMRASHILVSKKAKAKSLLLQLKGKHDLERFRKVAKSNTKDKATLDSAGDLGFFDLQGDGAPSDAIRKAAFTLKNPGEIYSSVVETKDGFHVVVLTAKRARFERSYEQAERSLRHKLLREKKATLTEALVGKLKKDLDVSIDYDALDKIQLEPNTKKKAK